MEERLLKKKRKLLIVVFSLLILITGVTYAFFSLSTKGNDTSKKNVVKSGNLEITLDGTSTLNTSTLEPGDTITKTFTVKNTGTIAIDSYNIYFSELINTYKYDELVYSLDCIASSDYCNSVSQTPVGTNYETAIVNNAIAAGVTHTYTLTITFIEMSSNQNYNKDQTFSFIIKVDETNIATAADYLAANYDTLGLTKISRVATGIQNYNTIEYRYQGAGTYSICSGVGMTIPVCNAVGGTYTAYDWGGTCSVGGSNYYTTSLDNTNCTNFGGTYTVAYEPNNYVTFNDEVWRIIGVFEVQNANNVKENRVKIVRSGTIGNYSWDTSPSNDNNGYGYSNWSQADLMKLLNPGYEAETVGGSLYYDSTSGTCYNGYANSTTTCNFTSTGLDTSAQALVGDTKWYFGGADSYTNILAAYTAERSTNVFSGFPNYWVGKVGLLYMSDLYYSSYMDGSSCGENWGWYSSCANSSWIYSIIANPNSINFMNVQIHTNHHIYSSTSGSNSSTPYQQSVIPTLYLKPSVKITSGAGTAASPYTLGL